MRVIEDAVVMLLSGRKTGRLDVIILVTLTSHCESFTRSPVVTKGRELRREKSRSALNVRAYSWLSPPEAEDLELPQRLRPPQTEQSTVHARAIPHPIAASMPHPSHHSM